MDCAVGNDNPALHYHSNEVPITQPIGDLPYGKARTGGSPAHPGTVLLTPNTYDATINIS